MVKIWLPTQYKELPEATSSDSMYSKRAGTSSIRGPLYETKLLSLLYFRAIHDDTIQEFQLATNIDKIGAFSDICFKAKVNGHNKPVIVFIQAKHRKNEKETLKIDLATYFDSYLKIRQNFGRDPTYDLFFKGAFNETECFFVIFSNVNVDYSDASATSGLSAKLNEILGMGGMVKQPNSEENIEHLTKKTVKDQISLLAEWIVGFIYGDKNVQLMQSEELFLRYHVILAQKVVDVSDIKPLERKDAPPYRIASFRQDFFDSNEEYIVLFRDTLYLEIIKRRRIEPTESDMSAFLTDFLADPTDATRLSKLIGTVVTYNNGQIEFDKQSTKTFRPNIKPTDVSQSTVNKAVELAAIEILSSVKFKVPAAFGNKDLTLSGSDASIDKRICHLALKMKDLLDKCKSSKVVTIDESLEDGFLEFNGGIAGGIGNIFVLDEDTKLMKITTNCETLGTRAKSLYTKLKSEVHNLHEYKFCFKVDKFPKLSLDCSHYEEKMARDFLNKILVYCNQAEEDELQEILKNEIEEIQRNQPNYYQAKTDAILLRYYDEIQKWWMRPQHASYLSQRIDLFRQLIDDIIKDPLMSSINLTYMSKIKQHAYTFTEDAVRSLNLQDQHSSTIIIAENCVLTVVKVLQHLNNKDHAVLDVEYIASLPTNDLNALRTELLNTNKERVLIIVCDKIESNNKMKTLKNIAEAAKDKTNIIITDAKSLEILQIYKYFPEADKILHDKKFSLIDVCKESQKSIFQSATVVFPGVELRLDHLLRARPKTGLTSAADADAAGVAAVTDKPTATGSRNFGMEPRGVVERQKRRMGDILAREKKQLAKLLSRQKKLKEAVRLSMKKRREAERLCTKKRREAERLSMYERARLRLPGKTDAAGVAAVTDKPMATGSGPFGMEPRGMLELKERRELRSMKKRLEAARLSMNELARSSGEADAAGATPAASDKQTATGSRGFGMEIRSLLRREKGQEADFLHIKRRQEAELLSMKKRREAESLSMYEQAKTRSAGEADAAGVVAVTDKPTATGSRAFGMEQTVAFLESPSSSLWLSLREAVKFSMDERVRLFRSEFRTILTTTFNGPRFYDAYKDAEFLKRVGNVERLLAQGHELLTKLRDVEPGNTIAIKGMNLERNTPLVIKKTGEDIELEDFDFTYNRLVGLAAAYAYENRQRFPNIVSTEAKALGLVWDQNDEHKCNLYLSAICGAEHFIDQFPFCPLLCGMRNYQLKELPIEPVALMSSIKNASGQTMAEVLAINLVTAERFWLMFPGTSRGDLQTLIKNSPELKKLMYISEPQDTSNA